MDSNSIHRNGESATSTCLLKRTTEFERKLNRPSKRNGLESYEPPSACQTRQKTHSYGRCRSIEHWSTNRDPSLIIGYMCSEGDERVLTPHECSVSVCILVTHHGILSQPVKFKCNGRKLQTTKSSDSSWEESSCQSKAVSYAEL